MILTKNEKYVLRFLATSIGKDHSINEIARSCQLTPNGAYKLLAKLEKEGVLKAKQIANIKSYQPDFENEKTARVFELSLMPDKLDGRAKSRADDIKPLKAITQTCILFGSYITTKKEPGDLDILFILKRANFEAYKKALASAQDIIPIKIQDVVQTADDVCQNLKKGDPVVAEVLRKGIVLWGQDTIVQVIKNAGR